MTPEEQAAEIAGECALLTRPDTGRLSYVVVKKRLAQLIREKDQRIATLEQENRNLREGLEVFADLCSHTEILGDDFDISGTISNHNTRLTLGHCRRAAALLKKKGEGE